MLNSWTLFAFSTGYVAILFAVAYAGDRRARTQGPPARKPWVYSLAMCVYCTSWTFYGAVGRAASSGWDFLPIYLGPALVFLFGGPLLQRIIRISQALPGRHLQTAQACGNLLRQAIWLTSSTAHVVSASLSSNRESSRHKIDPEYACHLCDICALSAEEIAHPARPLGEVIDPLSHRSLATRLALAAGAASNARHIDC